MILKGQVKQVSANDVNAQVRFIHKLLGLLHKTKGSVLFLFITLNLARIHIG